MESEIDGNQSCCEGGKVLRCRNHLAAPIWPPGAIPGDARGVLFTKNVVFRTFCAHAGRYFSPSMRHILTSGR